MEQEVSLEQSYWQYMSDTTKPRRVIADLITNLLDLTATRPNIFETAIINRHSDQFKVLLLGSATPENIRSLQYFVGLINLFLIQQTSNHILRATSELTRHLTELHLQYPFLDEESECGLQGVLPSDTKFHTHLRLARYFPRLAPEFHFTIIDINIHNLHAHANSQVASRVKNVSYAVMDARRLGIEPRSTNLIISDMVSNYFTTHQDNTDNMTSLARAIAPGGIILFSTIIDTEGPAGSHTPKMVVTNKDTGEIRYAWTVEYYLKLFKQYGFTAHEFGTEDTNNWTREVLETYGDHIPYRRYILS